MSEGAASQLNFPKDARLHALEADVRLFWFGFDIIVTETAAGIQRDSLQIFRRGQFTTRWSELVVLQMFF